MVYAEKLIGLRSEMLAELSATAPRCAACCGSASPRPSSTPGCRDSIKSVNHAYPNLSLEIEVDITLEFASARLLAQEIELAFALGTADRHLGRATTATLVRLSR